MTVNERLASWAATPDSEILVGMSYANKPYVLQRVNARDSAAGLRKFAEANQARVRAIRGVTCVIIQGEMPGVPRSQYRVVLSSVEPFT